jgi:hypothetical protein
VRKMTEKTLKHFRMHTLEAGQKFHLRPRKFLAPVIRNVLAEVPVNTLVEMLCLPRYQEEGATGENKGLSGKLSIKYLHRLSPRR